MHESRIERPRCARPIAALLFLALAACRSAGTSEAPAPPAVPWTTIAESVEGQPIRCAVFDGGGETLLLLAGIHGDDAAGGPLLVHLARRLAGAPDETAGRRVVIVPELNPDGLARNQRVNARGVDLNRNFPAANYGTGGRRGDTPLSEPESRAVQALIEQHAPARILSFHQAANLIDFDGPGEELARALAAAGPLEVRRMGARPGSLGSYAGVDLRIPVLTIELPRRADAMDADELWREYGGMLTAAIRHGDAPAP
jgi:protein MpaA